MWQQHDSSSRIKHYFGKVISYVVFIGWTLITVIPLLWMGYSSFKSNEELVRDIYALPHDLFFNKDDVYQVIPKALNVLIPEEIQNDPRERLIIESTEIAPTRRLHVFFLLKEELPEEIARLQPGDTLRVSQLPQKMQWEIHWKTVFFNYISALERGNLVGKFFNSVLYAVVSTFFIALFGVMAGFGLSKMDFKKISLIIGGLIGFGYLISNNSVIVPLFLMLSSLKLTDTHLGIILVYIAFGLPLSVMLATQFIRDLPDSLIESAFIDGAGYFRMFFSIIVPMTVPVITTISIISGLGIWNEFLLVLVMASSELTKSLPVGVYSFSSLTSTQLGWQLAALVIAVLPVMIIYFIFNNKLTQGVVAGAVKG
ncbi:MAG TPA: carbohydrate ABC transporter permease [Termitinemataceae bacterium]|nr:carbohydrate ABC transporter permease [Termitinemataceae bacterium]HOM24022.1 carbohydrate ABC transporter permease [Termitinemataceae bacterium]HPQ00599.1 carbohydrate ABC transporter permease [Termitinemataceae bacterium]